MTTIVIPDFPFSAHYYAEILEDMVQYMRVNVPELTDEDPTEPHMQLLRVGALAFHLNSTLLDLVANEMYLPTAKLRTSTAALLALIDVQLKQASPASAILVAQLSQLFTAARTIVPATSLFATLESKAAIAVEFETLDDVNITIRTDQVGLVYLYSGLTQLFTDVTAEAQTLSGTFDVATAWSSTPTDAIYIGHVDVLFDQIDFNISTGATGITAAVWEYFDGAFDQGQPTNVVNNGSNLTFNVNSILGTSNRTGSVVRVRSAVTGSFQDIPTVWDGINNKITTGGTDPFLGQASPSLADADYIVGTDWRELSNINDATNGLSVVGVHSLTFALPQTLEQAWSRTPVGVGVLSANAYWIRYRVIAGSFTAPVIAQIRIDQGKQYVAFPVTQGHSRNDSPLGSSNGAASQQFQFVQFPVVDDDNIVVTVTEATVDQVYNRVDNFLNSLPADRHYTLVFDDDGAAIITFGDGTNGKVPPAGVNNIRVAYRTMDDVDGNVGSNTITVNRAGVAFLATLTNPRSATGYAIREGSTTDDLVRLKVAGPATLRVRKRAVSTEDSEVMATEFKASDGSKPVTRALAIEEAFGPKTVEIVVVGPGGNLVNADKLSEVADFFNGNNSGESGVLLMNHQATLTNFTPHPINITMTLVGGNPVSVVTALTALLNPLSKKSDGTYTWQFGGEVAIDKLIQVIMDTSPPPTKCPITIPVADVVMATRELPTKGAITINGVTY